MRILFIFRRDFRINDNIGLNYCASIKDAIIYPIFIFTPEQIDKNKYKSNNSVQFMITSLIELTKHINITFCHGDIDSVIKDIVNENKIDLICTNTDYTPYAIKRDEHIKTLATKLNIESKIFHDILLFEPGTIKTQTDVYYQKFTPFYNTVIQIKVKKPTTIMSRGSYCKSIYTITKNTMKTFFNFNPDIRVHGGRSNAVKIINSITKFKTYEDTRNILSLDTTQLSAYLKFGCISIRECYHKMKKYLGIKSPLIRQLIWREFYYHLGYGLGRFGKSLKPQYDNIKWENNLHKFNSWCKGQTGYPIVDSCMTQLNTTGYMHNRGRLIVASFLIKNLHVDWRYGEKYFAQNLVDYDVLVNQGNWQWVAGCGADSMPYFRVFNPWIQSAKFDKDAEYIKKWLPELKNIENKHLHNWDKYNNLYKSIYYKPIVDYTISKKEGLALYKTYL